MLFSVSLFGSLAFIRSLNLFVDYMLSKHHLGWIIFIELHRRRQLYLRDDGWNALIINLYLSVRMQCSTRLTCRRWDVMVILIKTCLLFLLIRIFHCIYRLFTRPILRLLLRNLLIGRTQFVNLILTLLKHIIFAELFVLMIFVRNVTGCTIRLTSRRYIVLKLPKRILVFANVSITFIIWWRVNLCTQLIGVIYNLCILTKISIFNTYF